MKRWVITILLFLLIGAIVNVAVAWGCVLWSDPASYDSIQPSDWFWPEWIELIPRDTVGARMNSRGWALQEPDDFLGTFYVTPADRIAFGLTRRAYFEQPNDVTLSGERRAGGPYIGAYHAFAYRTRAGWPCRSVEAGTFGATPNPETRLQHVWGISMMVTVDYGTGLPDREDRPLPYRPLWFGFLVNTLLYAAILWLFVPGPFVFRRVLRRHIRRKRGRCPKCGYDLRGAPSGGGGCPECGWGREDDRSARSSAGAISKSI